MIARTYMEENLRKLHRLYIGSRSRKESLFYSKLAILELCGWIEESMDDVILRCSVRCLVELENRKYATKTIVKRTHGFDYEPHFREMMIRLFGLVLVERLERAVDPAKDARMRATLTALYTVRNAEAHTHLKGVTRTINAPSVTMVQFRDVYEGLCEYDRTIRRLVV
jgi:hypothetical protein